MISNITIIGGGANGVATLVELFLQVVTLGLQQKVKITLVEKEQNLGYGLAFGTKEPGHLLNTQAELMGVYTHEPSHFSAWLRERGGHARKDVKGPKDTEKSFTQRLLYGHYLAEQAKDCLERAQKNGLQIEIVQKEAIDISKEGSAYVVHFDQDSAIRTDFVVLALGTPKPNNFKELRSYSGYLDFPWPSERIKKHITHDDHVGVLGSSLSAIDAVLTLVDNGHQGKISLFSPDGHMPRVQPVDAAGYQRKYLTLENIHGLQRKQLRRPRVKDLFRLFLKEVAHFEDQVNKYPLDRRKMSPQSLLERDIQIAESGGDAWLNIATSLRYDSSTIWSWLGIDQKELFMHWVGTDWAINRHPMPLHNGRRLLQLFDSGKLVVKTMHAPVAVSYSTDQGKFQLALENGETMAVDKLINATGSSSKLEEMESPLLFHLLEKEMIKPYPIGGALINERTMQLVSPHGGEGLYALGHLVNGILMDVNAVWYNVKTVSTLSQDIISRVRHGQSKT